MLSAFAVAALLALSPGTPQVASENSVAGRAWSIAEHLLSRDNPYYLQFGGITTGAGLTVGPGLRLRNLAGSPLELDALALVSHRKYLLAEAAVSAPIGSVAGLRAGLYARRKYFPQEDFFGVGGASVYDDRVNYSYDETAGGGLVQLRPARRVNLEGRLEYRRPDVGGGHDDSVISIERRFTDGSAPGLLAQPDYLVGRIGAVFEGATPAGHPREGGRYEASVERYWGRGTSAYDFLRLDADLRQYVPIVPDRHLVALRGMATLTSTPAGGDIPFYYMPWLGGGRTLRGYREMRFHERNTLLMQAEYRWLPLRFVETAVFYDTGAVAPRASVLGRDSWLSDYGVGVRFGTDERVFFRVEAAFGSRDGTRVFTKFSAAF